MSMGDWSSNDTKNTCMVFIGALKDDIMEELQHFVDSCWTNDKHKCNDSETKTIPSVVIKQTGEKDV